MYSICTFGVGLSKSRTKLSFGSSVSFAFSASCRRQTAAGVCGSSLSFLALSASFTWAFVLSLLKQQELSSRHLSTGRISACAAKRGIWCGTSVRLDPHHFLLPHPQISLLAAKDAREVRERLVTYRAFGFSAVLQLWE